MTMPAVSTRRTCLTVATAAALLMLSLSELLVHVGGVADWAVVGRTTFLILCFLLVGRFQLREWVLVSLAALLTIGLFFRPGGSADILFALDRAAFFGAFIYLVTLLKEAAQRSPSVLLLGEYLTRQPAGRRYYALAGGGHVMGVLLNFGAISLLTPLILRGARATSDDSGVVAILDQQQLSALIRGFAWMIMWSPTALTQAVLFASFPSINLALVASLGIGASIVMIILGRIEGLFRRRMSTPTGSREPMAFPGRAGLRFAIVCLIIIGATFLTVRMFSVSSALGLMLVAPVFLVAWVFEQEFSSSKRAVFQRSSSSVGKILNASAGYLGQSAFTLGAAGFVGEAAARLLPVSVFAEFLGVGGMPDWLFLMVLPLIITLGGQVALSPILIVVFLSAIMNQLPVLPANPNLIVFSLGAGWAMSMLASPNASATLLISGVTGVSPTTLTWKWNGLYAIMCYMVFCASFVVLSTIFSN